MPGLGYRSRFCAWQISATAYAESQFQDYPSQNLWGLLNRSRPRSEKRLTPPKHLLRDGHLQHVTRERHASVSIVDTRSALEHLHHGAVAENLQDLRRGRVREVAGATTRDALPSEHFESTECQAELNARRTHQAVSRRESFPMRKKTRKPKFQ